MTSKKEQEFSQKLTEHCMPILLDIIQRLPQKNPHITAPQTTKTHLQKTFINISLLRMNLSWTEIKRQNVKIQMKMKFDYRKLQEVKDNTSFLEVSQILKQTNIELSIRFSIYLPLSKFLYLQSFHSTYSSIHY